MGVVILVLGLWFFGLLFVEVHEFVEEFRSFSPNAELILSIALSTIFYLSRLILQDVLLLPLPHHQVVFLQQPYQQVGETARKQLKSLQDDERERILSNLEELELHPRKRRAKADIKKLYNTNPELYRLRVGGFRIICAVVSDEVLGVLHKKRRAPDHTYLHSTRSRQSIRTCTKSAGLCTLYQHSPLSPMLAIIATIAAASSATIIASTTTGMNTAIADFTIVRL